MPIPLPPVPAEQQRGPVQVSAEILAVRPVGAYRELTLSAPGVAAAAEPGHFITVGVGGQCSALVLRRALALSAVGSGTVGVIVAAHGAGTQWIMQRQPGDVLDLIGPLGRPFPMPPPGEAALLVAGGYGAAPFIGLAQRLLAAGHPVGAILGAATADRLCAVEELRGLTQVLAVTTENGSAGRTGRVTDVLPELLPGAGAVYACGPMPMLRAVAAQAAERRLPCQVSVEEAMACGIGVCMTCVLPVIGTDGLSRFVRSCVDGPVFDGSKVRFDDIGTLPEDLYGAAGMRAAQ
ncbi:MAG: dihydroorotate dehydrogenase electron transfer subunit [Actinomycetota bacterium]|nr:dihydroorotate dehydrogenase electron transfer subunit [Actinomycetota bacterium]